MGRELDGWRAAHRRSADGGIDSDERVRATRPVVPPSAEGALDLGRLYWREVERASRRVIRLRPAEDGSELRLLGVGPALLRFGRPETVVGDEAVGVKYPIRGGVLARRPAGSITLSQSGSDPPELRASVVGFVPRLGRTPLYAQLQRRIHVRISRRYFSRLLRGARP